MVDKSEFCIERGAHCNSAEQARCPGSFPRHREGNKKKTESAKKNRRTRRTLLKHRESATQNQTAPRRETTRSPPRLAREMEETAAAAAAAVDPAAEKATSYRYWVREATGDAAPVPAPRKLDAADIAANPAPATLGSAWNQVRFVSLESLGH